MCDYCKCVLLFFLDTFLAFWTTTVIELRIDAYISLPGLGAAVVIRDVYPNRNIFVVCIQFPFIREEESVAYCITILAQSRNDFQDYVNILCTSTVSVHYC